ncbi:hypothetical protein HPP92_001103 [Vanilla planifolia]|uniref:Senescence regulator n=1 Tax=Vanilla planifolia TaxID=51239 RepID=A0A835S3J2_VANPL|nr:hypothetical protein HPP92_001103 [Vanilla planifolia]
MNFRPRRSVGSERFFSPFSLTECGGASAPGVELEEDEVFWTGNESPESNHRPRRQPCQSHHVSNHGQGSLHLWRSVGGGFRRTTEKNLGIVAALPEEGKDSFIHRKPSMSSSSSVSSSPSSSSSARLIPAIPKPRADLSVSFPRGNMYHQSASVNVPAVPHRSMAVSDLDDGERKDGDLDEEMLPPHEIVARASGRGSPMTTFSVLEGAGRTLKGKDLRRVRNAVLRQTGFLD